MATRKLTSSEALDIATKSVTAVIESHSKQPIELSADGAKKVAAFFAEVFAECKKIDIEYDAPPPKKEKRVAGSHCLVITKRLHVYFNDSGKDFYSFPVYYTEVKPFFKVRRESAKSFAYILMHFVSDFICFFTAFHILFPFHQIFTPLLPRDRLRAG